MENRVDEGFERLLRLFPDSRFALIPKYNESLFEGKEYNSSQDTKAAINSWNKSPALPDDARKWIGMGGRLGWIVPKGYVVIDIDNKEEPRTQEYVEKLIRKFEVECNYNYTSKGIHILFKDPTESIKSGAKYKTSINLVIDTRANNSGYIVLPTNDPHRMWGKWDEVIEDLPYFLKPCLKSDNTPSFVGMADGDGRNDALYAWRLKIEQSKTLTKQEVEKSIRIINENLFEIGLTNKELYRTVLRELDKPTEKVKEKVLGKAAELNSISESFIQHQDIVCYGSNIYRFNGVYYELLPEIELERYVHFECDKNLSMYQRREILRFIMIKTQIKPEDFDRDWYKIACGNGILNLVTGEITAPTKNDINTIYIPWNYDPDPPPSPRIDEFMKEICNGDILKIQFLYQIAGYCLLKKNLFEKFFIFRGEGGTGKSTYTNILQKLVGIKNVSHVSLADFDKDYYLSSTVSKLLNIDDDAVDGKVLAATGRFKSFVSGNIISVRQIYKDVIDYAPYATCVFSCNRMPRIMDNTTGLFRRMIVVEINNKILQPDPLFLNKITTLDMEYFLFRAVEGIKKAIEEGRFVINQTEKQLANLFKRKQSSINEWLFDQQITVGDLQDKETMPLYQQYTEWCVQNGYPLKTSHYSFKEQISAMYDMDVEITAVNKTNGKATVTTFVKRGLFDPNYKPF